MIQTIDQVIERLEEVVADSIARSSPQGYFAALYRRVTIAVRDAIENRVFQDPQRMEQLDVIFANRYLDAYQAFQAEAPLSQSWQSAFAATRQKLTTLQHLLLGMNAHISLDLGIAASQAERDQPYSLQADFYAINKILQNLIEGTQLRLTRIFRPLGIADRLLGPIDENLSMFSIAYARDKAWTQTLELSLMPRDQIPSYITRRDQDVAGFSQYLSHPPKLSIRLLLAAIRLLEKGNLKSRIKILDTP